MTSTGTFVDPMSKQEMTTKEITKFVSKDKYIMEMYAVIDGKETKMIEVVYTRK